MSAGKLSLRLKIALAMGYAGAAAVLVAALVFAVEPLAVLWLTPRHLPGFTVSLPSGETEGDTELYPTGRLRVATAPLVSMIYLRWDPHGAEAADLEGRFRQMAQREGGQLERTEMLAHDGARVPVWHFDVQREGLWISIVECGGRQLRINTSTMRLRGGGRLHRRIVASVTCQPDPADAAKLSDVPLALDPVPPGYRRSGAPAGELRLVSSRHMIIAHLVSGRASPTAAAKAIEASGILPADLHIGTRDGTRFAIESDDGDVFGWASTLPCRALDASVWFVTLSQVSADDARLALDLHRQARCREPGEAAQAWPQ